MSIKPLSAQAHVIIVTVYMHDSQRLHDNVSNLCDALLAYDKLAVSLPFIDDLHEARHDEQLIYEEIGECLDILHRSMALHHTRPLAGLTSRQLIEYAIGFLAINFCA